MPGGADDELTTTEARGLLDQCAELGRVMVIFSGGEPLMRPDWLTLARYARKLHLPTALASNGTLIDRPLAGRIASGGFHRVAVSLDGADAETHDGFRGLDGAFRRAIDGIGFLRAAGQAVQINATITRHNVDQLDGLYALAESLGAEALHLFLLVPVGCGEQIAASHQLAPQRYEQALNWLADRQTAGAAGLDLRATCAPHYHRVAAQRGMDLGPRSTRGCLAGLSILFVSHDGRVFPCGYLPVECGSLRRTGLAEIWRQSPVLADLRDFDKLSGKCGRCRYKAVCGGCRARALAATGDYLAPEPCCIYQPDV